MKTSHEFQGSVTQRYTLTRRYFIFQQNFLKVPVKDLNLKKTLLRINSFGF